MPPREERARPAIIHCNAKIARVRARAGPPRAAAGGGSKGNGLPRRAGSAFHHDAVEGLRVGVTVGLAQLGGALAHPLFKAGEVAELTRVAGERLDLEVDGFGDVDDDLWRLPPHHVDLADLVRLEALLEQLREGHVV